VVHGQNGLLCAADDVAALAAELVEFLQAKDALSQQAQDMALSLSQRFSLSQWAARTTDLYKKVLHQS
jgi:glycosyltransferase involved in cell wall biosynthesis